MTSADPMIGTELQATLRELEQLISFPSVSKTSNAEISSWVADRLRGLRFDVEQTDYRDDAGVRKVNVVGRRGPTSVSGIPSVSATGGVAYFCHTDVVPAEGWSGPGGDPFRALVVDDKIYGRGACDMKGSLAAMLAAAEAYPPERQRSPLWIVCTADEEVGFEGARRLVADSPSYRDLVAAQPACLIGEPTRLSVVHAHKGIEAFRVVSRGEAAHSSTGRGRNANVAMMPMLELLLELEGVCRSSAGLQDPRFEPPTLTWNFGVSDGCDAVNVVPGRSVAWASFRTMPGIDGESLVRRVRERAESLGLDFHPLRGGEPMWVDPETAFVREMAELTASEPHTVSYSTDGGQFIELRNRVVCGPGDIAQAHTSDEWLELDQLAAGIRLFGRAIERWCGDRA